MATIQDYLNNILKAVYGKDVRQSIHDAIYQCYQDGKAGQLDLTARTKIAEIEKNIQEILESGTTAETVQEKVQSVINSMVSDGMLANMTIADGSITKEKLAPDLEIEVTDESITTQKVADRAITMEKTDFYFIDSVELSGDWFSKGYNPSNTVVPRITFGTYEEVMENMPEVFTAVFKNQNDYIFSGISCVLSYSHTYSAYIPYETGNLVIDDEKWWYISVKKSDLKAEYDNHSEAAFTITASNVAGRWDGSEYYVISGALTEDVIRSNFVIKQISSDFVSAVSYANQKIGEGEEPSDVSIPKLNGKVWIALGDSYTRGMNGQLSALAEKYGMILDNRGIVSSSVCGDTTGSIGFSPMWSRANTIVSDYTSGYTINEVSYTADNVGLITFMGGANDGFGVSTWLGTGLNDTNCLHMYGATQHILNVLQENFPKAQMIVITQPSSFNRTVSSVTDDESAILMGFDSLEQLQTMTDIQFSNYAMAKKEEIIKHVAIAYGVPIVDMFHEFPSVFIPSNRERYWNADKLHLSAEGYQKIVDAVEQKLIELFS